MGSHNSPHWGGPVSSKGLIIPLQGSQKSPSRVSKFPFKGLKNPLQGSQKSPSWRASGSQRRQSATKHQLLTAEPVAKLILDLRSFVETPMRVKDAPLTLRRKLRTSFALSYQLPRLISICCLAAVSMAFCANSALAFSAKHRGVALAKPLCRHRSLNRMRSAKFFEEPNFQTSNYGIMCGYIDFA